MSLRVISPGPLTTVQDLGRPGRSDIGVGPSGAADRAAAALANRLVGNGPGAAVLETTFGGLELETTTDVVVAVTGAPCPGAPMSSTTRLRAGQRLTLGTPATGLRTYVAVRGGIDVEPVLGSRSTDLLARLGPNPLAEGDELPVGDDQDPELYGVDCAPAPTPTGDVVCLPLVRGPRDDWFGDAGWADLTGRTWTASSNSNRVGLRLEGEPLRREREGELASEGMTRGAVQVPPSGEPVVFLADHPITGGYPVIGYVCDEALDLAAQVRPGQGVRFLG
ncbi:biotin-dependent carboxyltransferase family protein [Kytococcus schroeteri]|uniref:5-oxoprolinase subunit C family protein n=1 Tax=Kytococcus schroeteri TaxID=138300 RepID=UPI0011415E7F